MDSGAYKNLVIIQKYISQRDTIGNPSGSWKRCYKFYAYINGLSGREYWEAATVQAETTVEVIGRWKEFFRKINTREYRLMINGLPYNIKSIDNIQFRNKTVKIRAVANCE